MKKYTNYIILGITILILIISIVFYFQLNVYQVHFYVDKELYQAVETRRNRAMNSIEAPEKEGYVFMGWYDEDGNVFDFENKIDKNMILIAHYGEIVTEKEMNEN